MSNAGDADEGTGQVLITHMPRPVCLSSNFFSTVFEGARKDLRRPMLSQMTFVASDGIGAPPPQFPKRPVFTLNEQNQMNFR